MSATETRDMGVKVGPFWWRYHLSFAIRFIEQTQGYELRWYGITVGDIGIGIFIRVRKAS